jgi:hypothetical protein
MAGRPGRQEDPYTWAMRYIVSGIRIAEDFQGGMNEYEFSIIKAITQVIEVNDPESLQLKGVEDRTDYNTAYVREKRSGR